MIEAKDEAIKAKDEAIKKVEETVKKVEETVKAKDETIKKVEETVKAKDETVKKMEETVKKMEDSSEELETRALAAEKKISSLEVQKGAAFVDRWFVESCGRDLLRKLGQKGRSSRGCAKVVEMYLLTEDKKLTGKAMETLAALKLTDGFAGIEQEDVERELLQFYHNLSKEIHYPLIGVSGLKRGYYMGLGGSLLRAATTLYVAACQANKLYKRPIYMLNTEGEVACTIKEGLIIDNE